MGGGRLADGERAVDDRLHAAGREQRECLGFDRLRNGRLVLNRARPQRRAGVVQALEHKAAEIHVGTRAGLEGDLDDATFDRGGS